MDKVEDFLEFVTIQVLNYLINKSKRKESTEIGLKLIEEVKKATYKPFVNYKELIAVYQKFPEKIKNLEIKIFAENKEISQKFKERIFGQIIDEGSKYIIPSLLGITVFAVANIVLGQ